MSIRARLVRVLAPERTANFCRVDTSVLDALFAPADNNLFPNLRKLVYPLLGLQPTSFGYLVNFLSPSIEEFALFGRHQVSKAVIDGLRKESWGSPRPLDRSFSDPLNFVAVNSNFHWSRFISRLSCIWKHWKNFLS